MAPITGSERFQAVGHTNTVCFVNAVNANCKTSAKTLASNDGRLILENIIAGKSLEPGAKHPLEVMCTQPWEWLIVSRNVERWIPKLPGYWSSALNSIHAVQRPKLELETAAETQSFCHSIFFKRL